MKTLTDFEIIDTDQHSISVLVDRRHRFTVIALAPDLIRVWLQPGSSSVVGRTWSIAPEGDVAWEGRPRESRDGFEAPQCRIATTDEPELCTERVRVRLLRRPLRLEWSVRDADASWTPLVTDRRTGAYAVDARGAIEHFQDRPAHHRYFGLGMKSGDVERTGRRFEFRSLDALGYNARTTDPLYQHWPFTLTLGGTKPFGLFYDNLSPTWIDLGNELDNYHPYYRSYRAEGGDLDYYLFVGECPEDLTRRFVGLTGRTAFPPMWSLGYSGSTMTYTDAPDAAERLTEFLDRCAEHRIPCDSFQLSSGYTSIGDNRYVFTWNRDKFPDPAATADRFARDGVHLAANIKPCLLTDHPYYDQARDHFVQAVDEGRHTPVTSLFWGAEGSHIDFTNPAAVAWWRHHVTEQLLAYGIASTWNDNNEYEVWDEDAYAAGFGEPIPLWAVRPLQGLLMVRASHEAQRAYAPAKRPWLIARSGCPGLQRYAQTWSGDNHTSWQTLRYNTRMGVGMSLSGQFNIGHDVGGFAGPKPDPELFVRWVQNGVMHPRFTIHSWNEDWSVNEPWMHPEVVDQVRDAIELRYRLLPYLYTLLWQAHTEHSAMVRPLFFDFPDDPGCYDETDDFLLGAQLLVASVVEPGQRTRAIRLPAGGPGWVCFHSGTWYAPGQTVKVEAPLERIPLLVRAGGALPMSERTAHVDPARDTVRTLRLFPAPGDGEGSGVLFDDDGDSDAWTGGDCLIVDWELTTTASGIDLRLRTRGRRRPAWQRLRIELPRAETRPMTVHDPDQIADTTAPPGRW